MGRSHGSVGPGRNEVTGLNIRRPFCNSMSVDADSFFWCLFSATRRLIFIHMRQEHIVSAAGLLLAFAKLSKAEVKYFMTSMNQYLFASPLARREMIKAWEAELDSLSHKRTGL